MSSFYKAFEDRFRGSRELITSRLKVYLPLIEPLKSIYPECKAIDLGCGRGEWLELLKNNGFQTHGIDLDAGMLEVANLHGLSTEQKDVIKYLKTLQDDSISIVSGFHIAEHLPFEVLEILIQESLRVLKPAGLLILETPNPENISVGSNTFYLDPTHNRPLPPNLLSFLVEYSGFSRVNIFRLNGAILNTNKISIRNILYDASPDYSIVAQKNAALDLLDLFNEEFNRKHGLSVFELLELHEQGEAHNSLITQTKSSYYLYKGFHQSESWGAWSSDRHSVLLIPVSLTDGKMTRTIVEIELKVFEGIVNKSPVLRIFTEEHEIGYVMFRASNMHSEKIVFEVLTAAAALHIYFELTHTASPAEIYDSSDTRTLGFGINIVNITFCAEDENSAESIDANDNKVWGIGPDLALNINLKERDGIKMTTKANKNSMLAQLNAINQAFANREEVILNQVAILESQLTQTKQDAAVSNQALSDQLRDSQQALIELQQKIKSAEITRNRKKNTKPLK
jgi:SAM-dependent methyltransferase